MAFGTTDTDLIENGYSNARGGVSKYKSQRGGTVDLEIDFLKKNWTTEGGEKAVKEMSKIAEEMNTAMDNIQSSVKSIKAANVTVTYTVSEA